MVNSGVMRVQVKFLLSLFPYEGSYTVKEGPTFRTGTNARTAASARNIPTNNPPVASPSLALSEDFTTITLS